MYLHNIKTHMHMHTQHKYASTQTLINNQNAYIHTYIHTYIQRPKGNQFDNGFEDEDNVVASGPKFIVFMAGGLAYSELCSAYNVSKVTYCVKTYVRIGIVWREASRTPHCVQHSTTMFLGCGFLRTYVCVCRDGDFMVRAW
jgi:hypothetical protein